MNWPSSGNGALVRRWPAVLVGLTAVVLCLGDGVRLQAGTLSAIAPSGASATVSIQVTGTGFDGTAANNEVTFQATSGATAVAIPTAVTVINAAQGVRRLSLRVPAGLPVGRADVTVVNRVTGEASTGLWLEVVGLTLPEVTAGAPGATNVRVRITGSANAKFAAGSRAIFGTGITVHSTTVESPTSVVATISIAATAAPGSRTVTVVTTTQTVSLIDGFLVGATPPPPPPLNTAPTVNAGADQAITLPAGAALSGSASDDGLPAGAALTIGWAQVSGSGTATFGTASAPTSTVTFSDAGTYVLRLSGNDGALAAADDVTIVVSPPPPPPNRPPTANAGGPYAVMAGQPLAFTGSGSDPDSGDTLTLTWAFGDGASGAGASPTHTYVTAGSVTATLTVSDNRGGIATAQASVVVTIPPPVNRNPTAHAGGPYAASVGSAIAFNGAVSFDPDSDTLSFAWLFGDGSAGAGVAPTHGFAAPGTYTATLLVGDGHGGADTATTIVQVSEVAAPVGNRGPAGNAGGPYAGVRGQSVGFDAAGSADPDGDTLSFAWNFGDGESGSGPAPAHTYAQAGEYAVSLLVTDGHGGSDLASARVLVSAPAVAGNQLPTIGAGGPYVGLTGSPVAFAATGSDPDGDALIFAWSFGDGSSGSGPTPSHVYLGPGPYTVVVSVSDQRGGSATASTTTEISGAAGNTAPIAAAGGPYLGAPGQEITFNFAASTDADQDPLIFGADFGDGGTGAGSGPTHTYAQPGTYVVTLVVSDGRGGANVATTSAVIVGQTTPQNRGPVANAGGPYAAAPAQLVQFDGSSSSDPDADALTFSWSFGDGGTGDTATPAHVYANPGQYSVALLVTDGRGGTAAATATVVVTASAPQNQLPTGTAGGPYAVMLGDTVTFAGAGSDPDGDAISLLWNFGDGSTGSGNTPEHRYPGPGDYAVVLLISDGRGGSATADALVRVTARATENRAPVAHAGGPYASAPQSPVPFDGSLSTDPDGDALTFGWNFGDGTSGSGAAASHAYVNTGAYLVTLTVTDARGQSASTSTSAVIGTVADRGPPLVTLSAPTEVLPGASVVVTATAADDVAVTAVTFEVSGAATSEETTAPYRRTVQVPTVAAPGATIHIRAIARDPSNNLGQAEADLRITFQPDTENPRVTLVLPPSGTPGASVPVSATALDNVGIARVVFMVGGVPISEDEQAPYEATVLVPASAVTGSTLPITARAVDFSGNTVEGGSALSIVSDADTIAPTVSLTAPAEVLRGGTLQLSATAADNAAVYAVTFFVNDVPLVTDTTSPYAASLQLGATQPAGTTLQLRAVARDFSGLEGVATAQSLITAPAEGGRGIVTGEVYDDTSGLPLASAVVVLTGSDDSGAAYAESTTSDARGRYILRANAGVGVVQVTRAGWSRVDRPVTVVAERAVEVVDARLTRFTIAGAEISPVLGGIVGSETDRLTIPPGALQAAATLALTPISQQGLQGPLPPGWSPVGGADVTPHELAFNGVAQLRVPNRFGFAAGTALVVARWDEATSAWRAVGATVAGGPADGLQADIAGGGQYLWLFADALPAAPPPAVVGNLLGGITPAALPAVQTLIDPQPRIVFYRPDVSSIVRGTVTATAPISSGSRLWGRVTESYLFFSGAELHPQPFTQDLFLYQTPGTASALGTAFPATPSMSFEALSLQSGVIALDLFVPPGLATAPLLAADAGGSLEGSGGVTLIVPPNVLTASTPFELQPLPQSSLGFSLPAGLEFVSAAQVEFPGFLNAAAVLSLALPSPAPDPAGLLLVRLQEVKGQTRLVLVGVGRVEGGRLVSSTTINGQSTALPGVQTAGRYLFVRVPGDIGFAAGNVTGVAGGPFAGALVSAAGLPVIGLSAATGAYVAASHVGGVTLTAVDVDRSDSGAAVGALAAAGQVVPIDISLVAQTPQVLSIAPANGSQNVALAASIVVAFSEPVDAATIGTGSDITLAPAGGAPIPGTVTLSNAGTTLTFRASTPLESNTRYTVTVGTGIRDVSGYALAQAVVASFDSLDTTPPPPPPAGGLSATLPQGGNTTVVGTQGTAGPRDVVEVFNVTRNTSTPVLIDPNGGFLVLVPAGLIDRLQVRITDQAGNRTVVDLPRFTRVNADGSVSTGVTSEGGRVTGPGGVAVDIAPGTFPDGALVTIKPVSEADFPVQIPAEARPYFGFNRAIELDFGGAVPTRYVNVSVPALGGETSSDQWIVTQVVEVNGLQALNVVDTAKFINGRIQTSSPPCPGVTARGVYGFHRATQSVGLNYSVMNNGDYSPFASVVDVPFLGGLMMPFVSLLPNLPQPVCYPVLTGRVTVVPNSVALTIAGTLLTPSDREIIVHNTTRGSENHFPRNVVELSLEMPGRDRDSYQVKALYTGGEQVLTGVTITAAQTGFVTVRPDPDRISVAVQTIRILNLTTGVTRDFAQQQPAGVVNATGGPSDTFELFVVDVNGVQRAVAFGVDASQYGPGNLRIRAETATIDPTRPEMDAAGISGPARTRVLLTTPAGMSLEIPADRIVQGGLSMGFDGDPAATYTLRVEYDTRGPDFVTIPNFRIRVTNTRTGQVIRTLTVQAPPRDEPLNLGVISTDTTPPIVLSGPTRLTNFDPAGAITFTFSEGMDAASLKSGITIRDAQGNLVQGEVRVSSGNRVATFVPFASLRLGEEYQVTLKGNDPLGTQLAPGNGVVDASGNSLTTMRLTITTFKPRLITGVAGLEPVQDLVIRRRRVGQALKTDLLAVSTTRTDTQPPRLDKFVSVDATDAETPVKIGGNADAASRRQRVTLAPGVSFLQRDGQTFTGDLAVSTTFNTYYSFLNFYDVTDPANVRLLANKLLTATPETVTDFNRRGTYHVLGFAKGVTTIRTATGLAAYAAVEEVGLMVADVGDTIPERGPTDRVREAMYPGDFTDVTAFNDRLYAVARAEKKLAVFDPSLAPLLSLDLPQRPRRIVVVGGYQSDDNRDGMIQPAELRDLAIIGTEDTRVENGVVIVDGSIVVVDVTRPDNPQIISTIPMPAAVRQLDVDAGRQRLFAGTLGTLFMIDLSHPAAQGTTDANNDGFDDRIMWQTDPSVYAKGLNGIRADADRGLLYAGNTDGLDVWGVYDNCCDLGAEMTVAPVTRQTGNRHDLLAKEKDALQQEIGAGLASAEVSCGVTVSQLSILEQGSGACLWKSNPATACGDNYQPGISDHDFEVLFPSSTPVLSQQCTIRTLEGRFFDEAKEPRTIIVRPGGSTIEFKDITFFAMPKAEFEAARLNVNPPLAPGGGDPTGDYGLGRQQLLLKWLLEGEYVNGPGLPSPAIPLEDILTTLRSDTRIPALEGFEWGTLQRQALAKGKVFIRVKGSQEARSSLHELFVKQLHEAGKAGIRATLARLVADPRGAALALAVTRERVNGVSLPVYEQNACLFIDPAQADPNLWTEKPCGSFEEYVASAAARSLRGSQPLGIFTRDVVVNGIRRFFQVKADLEYITSETEANRFIALTANFIDQVRSATQPIYQATIVLDPDRVKRELNLTSVVAKTDGTLLPSAKLAIVPHLFNRGFKTADEVEVAMYTAAAGAGQPAKTKLVTLHGGDNLYTLFERDASGAIAIDQATGEPRSEFELGPIDQTSGFNQPKPVVFTIDLLEHKVKEANRENNYAGFYYYILDPQNPTPPSTPEQPPLPISVPGVLDPDLACLDSPGLQITQSLIVNGQELQDQASIAVGQTVTAKLRVRNLGGDTVSGVRACTGLTNLCYEVPDLAPGVTGEPAATVTYTPPTPRLIDAASMTYAKGVALTNGNATRLLVGCEPYRVVPFLPDPNPLDAASVVMRGGKAYRWFRVVDRQTGRPAAGVSVTAAMTGANSGTYTFTTDSEGIIATGTEPGMAIPFAESMVEGLVDIKVSSMNGATPYCATPTRFAITFKPMEFTEGIKAGASIGGAGALLGGQLSLGVAGNLTVSLGASRNNASTTFTKMTIGRGAEAKAGLAFKADLFDVGLKLGGSLQVTGPSASVGFGVAGTVGDRFVFPAPLSTDNQIAVAGLFLDTMMKNNLLPALGPLGNFVLKSINQSVTGFEEKRSATSIGLSMSAEGGASLFNASLSLPVGPAVSPVSLRPSIMLGLSGAVKHTVGFTGEHQSTDPATLLPVNKIAVGLSYNVEGSAVLGLSNGLRAQSAVFASQPNGRIKTDTLEKETAYLSQALSGGIAEGVKMTLLLDLANDLELNKLDLAFVGRKTFGWKTTPSGARENVGSSSALSGARTRTYSVSGFDNIVRVLQDVTSLGELLDDAHRASLAVNPAGSLILGPVQAYELVEQFLANILEDGAYSEALENGAGISIPIGFKAKILGTGVDFTVAVSADHTMQSTAEKGVFFGGRRFKLEDYHDAPVGLEGTLALLGNIASVLTTSSLGQGNMSPAQASPNPAGGGTVASTQSARLELRNDADFATVNDLLSYPFETRAGPALPMRYSPDDVTGAAGKPHYGFGGFHHFEPTATTLTAPARLVLDYYDAELAGVDEDSLAIYRWNPERLDWDFIGGTADPSTNTVTAEVTRLGLYTLGTPMLAGDVAWTVTETTVTDAGLPSERTLIRMLSNVIGSNNGGPVLTGALFHVYSAASVGGGTMFLFGNTLTDADPLLPGAQVPVRPDGRLEIQVEYPGSPIAARIIAFADRGTAFGEPIVTMRPQ